MKSNREEKIEGRGLIGGGGGKGEGEEREDDE